jgi:pentatricopeptide repeat protein
MAPGTSVVHRRRAPLPGPRESPTNKDVIEAYLRGKREVEDVLRVTTSVIKKSDLEGAFACLKAMEEAGVDPDVITYNALISACEKAGEVETALTTFNDMRAAGIIPNLITYNALISACEKAGEVETALKIFEDNMQAAGIIPDVITYNALISACEKAGKVERAQEIFEGMRAAGIIPDVITYSALISACEKAGQAGQALEIFEGMRAAGIIPNVITYSALISACEKAGQAELALKIFDDMRAADIIPNVITYNALISACVRGDHPADARRLLKEAVSDDVFHPSLGYDAGTNSLDFHLNGRLVTSPVGGRARAVSADVAQVLFDHHLDLGNLSSTTKFVVGQHGDDVIKDAIAQRMREKGWTAVQDISHGKVNPGRLVVAQKLDMNRSGTGSHRIRPTNTVEGEGSSSGASGPREAGHPGSRGARSWSGLFARGASSPMAPDTSVAHGRPTSLRVQRESPTNEDLIASAQRMRTKGWTVVQGISLGKVNPELLVVAQNPPQTAPIASTLNAAAKEFVPPGQTAPIAPTLNAAAKEFVPSGPTASIAPTLNAAAKAFVPSGPPRR